MSWEIHNKNNKNKKNLLGKKLNEKIMKRKGKQQSNRRIWHEIR